AVSRLTHQVEIVRDTFAGLVMTVRGFLFAVAAALAGLLSLAPVVVLLVLPPVLVGVAGFAVALPVMSARQRRYVLADEQFADAAGAMVGGLRDIAACGAGQHVASSVGQRIHAQARAQRAIAATATVRSLSLPAAGWLPLVLVLLAAPRLSRSGVTAGTILGALTYVL